jgi:phage terminase small subunit
MPVLKNPRHERFALLLAEGLSAYAAYEQAGYKPHDGNCIRLRGNERVQARLAELQQAAQKKTEVTIESLMAELEEARVKAVSLDQMSAAVKSISEKAKISGLLVQKVEIGPPGSFENCNSTEAVVDELLKISVNHYHDLRDDDRQALIEMCNRQTAETAAFIESIKARPVVSVRADKPRQLSFGNGKAPSVT